MSLLAIEPNHSLLERKYNTTNGSVNHVDDEISEATLVNECLDALLYQDARFRPLTLSTRRLIEEAKPRIGEASALFIEGVRMYSFKGVPFMLFAQAEEKGCKHPVLYYFMGECYMDGEKGADKDVSKAFEYYQKAIADGCGWSLLGRYDTGDPRGRVQDEVGFQHLLDLEMEGHIDGLLFNRICSNYGYEPRSSEAQLMKMTYLQRSIDNGYAPVNLYGFLNPVGSSEQVHADKVVSLLVEIDGKGLGIKDDRLLDEAIRVLIEMKNGEMALHYCDVLIQRRSPLGYQNKAYIYEQGLAGVSIDMSKAVSIWEAAVNEGLANYDMCYALQDVYSDDRGVPTNGLKVLEYGEKALLVATRDISKRFIYGWLADVYENGIKPVKKDGRKMLEYYERAVRDVNSHSINASIYLRMASRCIDGCASLPPNGAKTLEYLIKALEYCRQDYQFDIYSCIASVCEAGIPPIAQNPDIAAELRRMRRRE